MREAHGTVRARMSGAQAAEGRSADVPPAHRPQTVSLPMDFGAGASLVLARSAARLPLAEVADLPSRLSLGEAVDATIPLQYRNGARELQHDLAPSMHNSGTVATVETSCTRSEVHTAQKGEQI